MKLVILFLIFALVFIGQASAGSYSVNGTTYDTTWDGRVIPSSQIIFESTDDTILVQELIPATAFTVGNDTIYIHNNFTSFKRDKFKISPVMTFPKTLLASRMINYNTTVAYLVFPYSLSRVKDYISENEIKMGNWTFRAGQEHIDIYDDNETQNILPKSAYEFKIVDDEIRLYFLKAEANKLLGNITFEMNSWSTNGNTTPAWQNTSKDHTVSDNPYGNVVVGFAYMSGKNGLPSDMITYNSPAYTSSWGATGDFIYQNVLATSTYYYPNINETNMTILVDANQSNNPVSYSRVGIAGRVNSTNWSYQGTLRISTLSTARSLLLLSKDGTNIFANTSTSPSLTANIWYNQRLDIYENNLNYFLNGTSYLTKTDSGISNGSVGLYCFDSGNCNYKNFRAYRYGQYYGNLTSWYDSGSGNEVYQIDVNATTPTNTNYTLWYANNGTGSYSQLGATLTGNNSLTISGTKYQNTNVQIRLAGNQTATPELIQVTFFDQAAEEEAAEAQFSKVEFLWWE